MFEPEPKTNSNSSTLRPDSAPSCVHGLGSSELSLNIKLEIENTSQKYRKSSGITWIFKGLTGRNISPLNFLVSTTQALLDIYNQTPLCVWGGSPSCIDVKTAGIQALRQKLVPCSGCFYFHAPADEERGRPVKATVTGTIRRGYDFHSLAHHFQTVQQALQR